MLFGTAMACAVVLGGKVYIGGGNAHVHEQFIIQVYMPESGEWSRLADSPMRQFAMVVVSQQVVLVGGYSHVGFLQSALQVLDSTKPS